MVWKGDSSGRRLARSLITLVDQVDAMWPNRDKSTDGSIGDLAHQARASDHNPNAAGVVTALDLDRDIAVGFNARNLAERLIASRDRRIKYIISNAQIISSKQSPWVWRPYTGENAHREHIHVSVDADPALYDDPRPWAINLSGAAPPQGEVARPLIMLGDSNAYVSEAQTLLGLTATGTFDAATDAAVRALQTSHGLHLVDGKIGEETWPVLLASKGQPIAPIAAGVLSPEAIARIVSIAGSSVLSSVSWKDRGRAPAGYIKGMAVTFAKVYLDLKAGKSSALAMTAPLGDPSKDALAWYGVTRTDSAGFLRALFALLIGLGMRESSGKYYEGRDASASNTSSDTAEAGLFQQSFNSFAASKELPKIFDAYTSGGSDGFVSIFREGLSGSPGPGSGDGAQGLAFQSLCKSKPAFAVECAAVGLRVLRSHWGPIVRKEAELRPEADALLQQVQQVVDAVVTKPITEPIIIPPTKPGEPATPPPDTGIGGLAAIGAGIFLLMKLLEKPMDKTPGIDLSKILADLPKFIAILQHPTVQKALGGKPVTLQEWLDLLPLLLTLLPQPVPALTPPVTVMPVTEPQPAPPVAPAPVAPAPIVDPAKPVAPTSPGTIDARAGLVGAAGALIAWLGGAVTDPQALMIAAGSGLAAAFGIPAPAVALLGNLFKGGMTKIADKYKPK